MPTPRQDMMAQVAASVDDAHNSKEQGAPARSSTVVRMAEGRRRHESACWIRIDRIIPDPNQPRTEFDSEALEQLAASLKARGQLQPIRVRWDDSQDHYIIVVGERRWRAARMAGLDLLSCIVVEASSTADDLLEDQLVENCLREDLKPVEQARAFKALMDARGLSQQALADRLHIGQASVARALALLDLAPTIQADIDAGTIPASVGAELARISDTTEQTTMAEAVKAGHLRRKDLKPIVKGASRAKARGKGASAKARKPPRRVIRTKAGPRVTLDYRKGLDDALIVAALREALSTVESETQNPGPAEQEGTAPSLDQEHGQAA